MLMAPVGRRPDSGGPDPRDVRAAVYHWRFPVECGKCGSRLPLIERPPLEAHCSGHLGGCGWTSYLHPSARPRIEPAILRKYQREKPRRSRL